MLAARIDGGTWPSLGEARSDLGMARSSTFVTPS